MVEKHPLINKQIEIWAYPVRTSIEPYIYMSGRVVDYRDGNIIFDNNNAFPIKDFGVIFRVKETK